MRFLILLLGSLTLSTQAAPAITTTIPTSEIANYNSYNPKVKALITNALTLTEKNLTYQFGSANPASGGMDCSGTVYYLLHQLKISSPRQSDEQYFWAKKSGKFYPVHATTLDSPEFKNLQPGDLLFWEGTYAVKRSTSISHVMFYLGKNPAGEPLMIGASDGRTYKGKKMWGVSVFDFKLPAANSPSHFLGYSCIPDYTC
jgi:cell wall-associated NlpC family hydrolase